MEPQPGLVVDRYELVCPLAQGGMGSVWLARSRRTGGFERMFALKMVLPTLAADPNFRAMFLDESRVASSIRHPAVAAIVDVGEFDGGLYLAMEWVEGDSLQSLLQLTRSERIEIPLAIVLQVMSEVCEGLHAIHEACSPSGEPLEVVHRDISPHNILISTAGRAMIIDFGIAKSANRQADKTEEGILKGKIRYMPREQALGDGIDRRADVWALGAVFYALLTSRPPYDGLPDAVVAGNLISLVPPAPLPADVPQPVREIVNRCLSFAPVERFPTAAELRIAIEAAIVDLGERIQPSTVAAFFKEKLSARAAVRRAKITNALRLLDHAAPVEDSVVRSPYVQVENHGDAPPANETLVASVIQSLPDVEPTATTFTSLRALLLAAGVVCLVLGGAALARRPHASGIAVQPSSGPPPALASASVSAPGSSLAAGTSAPSAVAPIVPQPPPTSSAQKPRASSMPKAPQATKADLKTKPQALFIDDDRK